jgi:hypothetical protein
VLFRSVPSVGTTTGAFAGIFQWGPAERVIQISNEAQLVEFFGNPAKCLILTNLSSSAAAEILLLDNIHAEESA